MRKAQFPVSSTLQNVNLTLHRATITITAMAIQHGIRAVPTKGTRFRTTSGLLTKDNYTPWSDKMKALLLVNRVWDLVSGKRTCPNPAPAAIVAFGTGNRKQ